MLAKPEDSGRRECTGSKFSSGVIKKLLLNPRQPPPCPDPQIKTDPKQRLRVPRVCRKQFSVANRDLAVIESIAPDGRISAGIDDDRQIEFNTTEHRHLDHCYIVISHSSQGLTAERVFIHADTSVHPDLLSSCFGYVAVSRASHEATIFTDDVTRVAQQVGMEVNKISALEIRENFSFGHGISVV